MHATSTMKGYDVKAKNAYIYSKHYGVGHGLREQRLCASESRDSVSADFTIITIRFETFEGVHHLRRELNGMECMITQGASMKCSRVSSWHYTGPEFADWNKDKDKDKDTSNATSAA